jgi:hypothetical protein
MSAGTSESVFGSFAIVCGRKEIMQEKPQADGQQAGRQRYTVQAFQTIILQTGHLRSLRKS